MEKNNIILYNINETTIREWHKKKERTEEILMLMQGKDIPSCRNIANDPLPAVRPKPSNLQGSAAVMTFPEPEDRSGQAKMRYHKRVISHSEEVVADKKKREPQKKKIFSPSNVSGLSEIRPRSLPAQSLKQTPLVSSQLSSQTPFVSSQSLVKRKLPFPSPPTSPTYRNAPYSIPGNQINLQVPTLSRSTFYRHQKEGVPSSTRRGYACRKCGRSISDGHRRYRSYVYCPYEAEAETFEVWAEKKKKEIDEKKS